MDRFELLDWDSAFFGFPVARISPDVTADAALPAALQALRARGVRLAYWFCAPDAARAAHARALGGTPVGTRAVYRRALVAADADAPAAGVARYARREASDALVDLAQQAGGLSRFAIDPAMPSGTAQRLFRIWIERSVRGEIADAVYVAQGPDGTLAGMIATSRQGERGVIGLVAVGAASRGAGLGQALVAAAHRHFVSGGLREAEVVTQGENDAACRLYARAGYRLAVAQAVFHFWL
jgi:dTDP-4-amino-4,6-dideoxy-D-galactose acyltransferase